MATVADCSNCKFWRPNLHPKAPAGLGECRRNRPEVFVVPVGPSGHMVNQSHWPPVMKTEWCGEHEFVVKIEA